MTCTKAPLLTALLLALVAPACLLAPAALGAQDAGSQPSLDASRFSGPGNRGETILHVPALGRYALLARGSSGTSLELVDRMAGVLGGAVSDSRGASGAAQDSAAGFLARLDLFLEPGDYKVKVYRLPSATVELSAVRFTERPAPVLVNGGSVGGELHDRELAGYWLRVPAGAPPLLLEIQGRSLADASLWKDGLWDTGIRPLRRTLEFVTGKPRTVLEFSTALEPGDYLLVCAGGPRAAWAVNDPAEPFFLARGARYLGETGLASVTIPDRGAVSFLVSPRTQLVEMEARDNAGYALILGTNSTGQSRYTEAQRAVINDKSLSRRCTVYGRGGGEGQWVTLQGPPGAAVNLRWLAGGQGSQSGLLYQELASGPRSWLTTVLSTGEGQDSIDTTGLYLQVTQARNKPDLSVKALMPLALTADAPLRRRVNLTGTFSFILQPSEAMSCIVMESAQKGASGMYRFRLLDDALLNGPQGVEVKPGSKVDLQAKLYLVTVRPVKAGILEFALTPAALKATSDAVFAGTAPAPSGDLFLPATEVDSGPAVRNLLILGSRDRVPVGVQLRSLPLAVEDPVCVRVDPSHVLAIPFTNRTGVTLTSTNSELSPKTALIDGTPWTADRVVPPGSHTLSLTTAGDAPAWHVISGIVPDTSASGPAPTVVAPAARFPVFSEGAPAWKSFARNETAAYLLEVREPASYRVTTAGRLAMGISIRTYLRPSLVSVSQNADGRNAAVTSYLRPGTYLVQAQAQGASMGRAGVALERLDVLRAGTLSAGGTLRATVPAGTLMSAEIQIDREAACRADCLGLGRSFPYRLEDADGWPVGNPIRSGGFQETLQPGGYRWISMADPVATRRVLSLSEILPEAGFDARAKLLPIVPNRPYQKLWVESEGRPEDVFTLDLPAEVSAFITVSKGMIFRVTDPSGTVVYQGSGGNPIEFTMARGTWRIGVTAVDVDNLRMYEMSVGTEDLYVGTSRAVGQSPQRIPVTVGAAGTAEIWSSGGSELDGVLLDEEGTVVAPGVTIPDDWNFRIVAAVKPGRYELLCTSPLAVIASQAAGEAARQARPPARQPVRQPSYDDEEGGYAAEEYGAEEYGAGGYQEETRQQPQETSFGLPGGPDLVRMIVREEKVLPAAAGSLDAALPMRDEVAVVAFTAGEAGVYRLSGQAEGPLSAAVLKGDRLLATGTAPLFLPLAAGGSYTLRFWQTADTRSEVRLSAARESTAAAAIAMPAGASFTVEAGPGPLLYSPGTEMPFGPMLDAAVSTAAGAGWAVRPDGSAMGEAKVTPVILLDSAARAVLVGPVEGGFSLRVPAGSVALVRTDNAGKPVGLSASAAPGGRPALYDWQGARVDGRASVVGLREGEHRGRLWETAPNAAQARRVAVGAEIFPVAPDAPLGTADRTVSVPPRPAVSFTAGARQAVRVSLERGMAAFAWAGGAAGTLDAPDGALTGTLEPAGGTVVVVNRTRAPALCVLRPSLAAPRLEAADGGGWEAVLPAGTQVTLSVRTAAGARPYLWGQAARVRWLGQEDGLLSAGEEAAAGLPGLLAFPAGRGLLELTAGGGPLRVWVSTPASLKADLAGRDPAARPAPIPAEGGTLTAAAQAWSLPVDRRTVVRVRAEGDGVSGLFDASGACLAAAAAAGGRTLLALLEPGAYTVTTRPFRGAAAAPGAVQARALSPVDLGEDGPGGPALIGPRDAVLYRFTVKVGGRVGCGIRGESDGLSASLFDGSFRLLDTGRIFVRTLPAGVHYLLVESGDSTQRFSPVVFGLAGNRTEVPDDVVRQYRGE
jgi:hypothetical protein